MPPDDRSTESSHGAAATLTLLIAIARAFKSIDDYVRPRLADLGLAMTEFAVLEVLLHKGPIPLGDLSEQILITGASTTYVVKKLERRRLLRRTPSKEDNRVIVASLTPAGRTLIQAIFPHHVEHLSEVMKGLSTQEKRTAAMLLRKLTKATAQNPAVKA